MFVGYSVPYLYRLMKRGVLTELKLLKNVAVVCTKQCPEFEFPTTAHSNVYELLF